jgi:TRAP-type C4-dicarboxylate transport system substrate-binding protein
MKTALLATLAAAALVAPAWAADPIKLRVADSFPAEHYLVRLVLKPWMEEVTRRTNGAVVFQHYPNQQLGKAADLLRLTQTGLVDIGYIAPSYVSDKMPHSEVAQLPGQFDTVCPGTMAYWKAARTGAIARTDYAPNKVHLLLETVLPPYHAFTVKTPIKTVADLNGLKLRTTGGAQDLTVRSMGGVPVRMAAPDAYESLSRGTMDGLLFPLESVISYGLDKLVKNGTDGVGFGSFIVAYSIGTDTWNRLTPEIRKAMDDVAEEMEPKLCQQVQDEELVSRRKLEASGVVFAPLPAVTVADIHSKLNGVALEWAKGLDARGKAGTEVLKEFDALLHPVGR